MQSIRFLSIVALAPILGACVASDFTGGDYANDWNTAEVRALSQHGDRFQQALHRDYVTLAQIEIDEGHWQSATYYNVKARQAAAGDNLLPTAEAERSNSTANVGEVTKARASLMHMLDAGGRSKAPVLASRAQSQFDCWVEELEENIQPDDIALCRAGFRSAMEQANAAVLAAAPVPAPAPKTAARVAPTPTPAGAETISYTVYFDHNSLVLSDAAMATNNDAILRVKSSGAKSVRVSGYTDTSGSNEYNRKLAERRARVVSTAIKTAGIKPVIDTDSFGEDRLAVQTGDNVREWQNRRVVIRVH